MDANKKLSVWRVSLFISSVLTSWGGEYFMGHMGYTAFLKWDTCNSHDRSKRWIDFKCAAICLLLISLSVIAKSKKFPIKSLKTFRFLYDEMYGGSLVQHLSSHVWYREQRFVLVFATHWPCIVRWYTCLWCTVFVILFVCLNMWSAVRKLSLYYLLNQFDKITFLQLPTSAFHVPFA